MNRMPILTLVFLTSTAAAQDDSLQPAGRWREPEGRTVLTIEDGCSAQRPFQTGKWRLRGTLEVRFAGRVLPHENTKVDLFGPNVDKVEGRFRRVVLPEDWMCQIDYLDKPPWVVARNFHPRRAPAFPGAEGFGKYTLGGRGGRVIEVTNLNDDGPGSLRAACESEGPRIIVFRVSGTIHLRSNLVIREPFITIAGQSAPGDGICVKGRQVRFQTEHVIIRYMRFRPGDLAGVELDGFGGVGNFAVIDHCSVSWSIDEALSITKGSNFTVQWCMVTESLYRSVHRKGPHGYGGIWGGPGGSWHHNLLAHHSSRNPRVSGYPESGLMDFRNNVIYNWGFNSAYGGELWPRNWINNYYKSGPATRKGVRGRIFIQRDRRGKMYVAGNYVHGFPEITQHNWKGIDFHPDGDATEETLRVNTPFCVAPVTTHSALQAYEMVLKSAGASLSRDAIDTRIVEEVRSGQARYGESWGGGGKGIIDSQSAVGGWPTLGSLPAPPDTDHDGMPDAWERSHGLDPRDPADGSVLRGESGYTNVEHYLNQLAANPIES